MSTCIWMATLYVFLMSVSHNYHQCIYRPMMLAISQTASHQQTWSQPTQSKSPLRSNVQRALLHRGNIETPVSGIKCKVNKCKYLQAGPAHRRGGSVCGFFNAKSINATISRQVQGKVGMEVPGGWRQAQIMQIPRWGQRTGEVEVSWHQRQITTMHFHKVKFWLPIAPTLIPTGPGHIIVLRTLQSI